MENIVDPPVELNQPNQTVYIKNLNEKVKIDELKQALFYQFSPYGEILDIIAKKNIKMRGQAFIIYKDLNNAQKAVNEAQRLMFFGKPMNINFAKAKSDVIAKMDGTYVPTDRPKLKIEDRIPSKKIKTDQGMSSTTTAPSQQSVQRLPPRQIIVPNNILFIEHLPEVCTEDMLVPIFGNFPGFREVRLIPTKRVAFAEYDDDLQAGIAMQGLQGRDLIEGLPLQISYAKK